MLIDKIITYESVLVCLAMCVVCYGILVMNAVSYVCVCVVQALN